MRTIARKRSGTRPPATLFDGLRPADRDDFRDRVRGFAVEVAKRHRRDGGDLMAMLGALRAWHRTWSICAPSGVPPLDEEFTALAIAAYEAQSGAKRRAVAA